MSAQTARSTEQSATAISASPQPLKSKAPWKRAIITLLALLYIISPLDLIPDVIPMIGWLDDLGVLAWAARQVFFNKGV